MKLPNLPVEQPNAVQGFGEVEAAAGAKGEAGQRLAGAVQSTSMALEHLDLSVREGQLQTQALIARKNYQAMSTSALTTLNTQQTLSYDQLGSYYNGTENIPKEVLNAIPGGVTTKFTNAANETTESPRQDIPMYAVRPYLYRHIMQPNIDNVAQGIDEPGWQRAFKVGTQLDLEGETQNVAHRSALEAVAYANQNTVSLFEESMHVGDWSGAETALKMGANRLTPANLEIMQRKLTIAKSEWAPNEIIGGQDIARIQSLKTGLQNIETNGGKFQVTDSLGQTENVDTSALKESQRRSFIRFADMAVSKLNHIASASENDEDKGKLNAARTILNHAYETGDLQSLQNFAQILNKSGISGDIKDQKSLDAIYETAHRYSEWMDPKVKKTPPDSVMMNALWKAADQASRGEEVTVMNPATPGARFNFQDSGWDLGAYLAQANVPFNKGMMESFNNKISGKQTTPAQLEQQVSSITKSLTGTNSDELAQFSKRQTTEKQAYIKQNASDKEMAVRSAALEALQSHQGSMTPAQWDRFRQEYLATEGQRNISQPGTSQWFGAGDYPFGSLQYVPKVGDMPGRVFRQLQAQHTNLNLPENQEAMTSFWKEFYQPYHDALQKSFTNRFGYPPKDAFYVKAAAAIRDNQKALGAAKITTAEHVADYIVSKYKQ